MNQKQIGETIRAERLSQEISYNHLTREHGIRYETVKQVEDGGNCEVSTLLKLLNILKLKLSITSGKTVVLEDEI